MNRILAGFIVATVTAVTTVHNASAIENFADAPEMKSFGSLCRDVVVQQLSTSDSRRAPTFDGVDSAATAFDNLTSMQASLKDLAKDPSISSADRKSIQDRLDECSSALKKASLA